MKKILFFFLMFIQINFLFSQIHTGIDVGGGVNKEIIYSNYTQIPDLGYALSYKSGLWMSYSLTDKLNFNTELNVFKLNTKHENLIKSYIYLENPVFVDYGKKLKFGLGIVNNLNIRKDELSKRYTSSMMATLSYPLCKRISLQFRYSREFIYNNVALWKPMPPGAQKNYNQNYMLILYFRIK